MKYRNYFSLILIILSLLLILPVQAKGSITVASKEFPESRLLGEMLAILIENNTDLEVERRHGLGGTTIIFEALRSGSVDLYAEYTGTAMQVVLQDKNILTDPDVVFKQVKKAFHEKYNLEWFEPFGFNNTYAIAMKKEHAKELGISKISDIKKLGKKVQFGVSHEFAARLDGFPGLIKHYQFDFDKEQLKSLQHGLAYRALKEDKIDVTDAYSTDGKLEKYDLMLLEDDLHFFPPYYAAPVIKKETLKKYPKIRGLLEKLEGKIDDKTMIDLNYRVEEKGESFEHVAADFLNGLGLTKVDLDHVSQGHATNSFWGYLTTNKQKLLDLTLDHLKLTGISVFIAILIGLPLGVLISRIPKLATPILGSAGVMQTVPSLALLGFMVPFFGIGSKPAIIALTLYALLPIIRNTYTGLNEVSPALVEAGRGMGLTNRQILFLVELPLAVPIIMAGVRTATVIAIGTATLASFIGAGGLGEPIITGITLLNMYMILSGVIASAALAIIVDNLLGLLEKWATPNTGKQPGH